MSESQRHVLAEEERAVVWNSPKLKRSMENTYNFYQEGVCDAFRELTQLAREVNSPLQCPEFVLLGGKGHGKSALLEGLIGHPFNVVGVASRRPLFLTLLPKTDLPKGTEGIWTIKGDEPYDSNDLVLPMPALAAQIARRNDVFSTKPIYVQYESRHCLRMTLVDTPGLFDENHEKIEALALALARPQHRVILCVKEAPESFWGKSDLLDIAKKADPHGTRTIVAYTKFYRTLRNFVYSWELSKYYSSRYPGPRSFFVSLFSSNVRAGLATSSFREKTLQAEKRDSDALKLLRFDVRADNGVQVGIEALRSWVLGQAQRVYLEQVPVLIKQARSMHSDRELRAGQIKYQQQQRLDGSQLRLVASSYASEFLRHAQSLLCGSAICSPVAHGQTTQDEWHDQGVYGWRNWRNDYLELNESDIPLFDAKLFGAKQLERLLAEFKAVASAIVPDVPNESDVATAGGLRGAEANTASWAASDIAQHLLQREFRPLIKQLLDRAVYIIRQVPAIAAATTISRLSGSLREFLAGGNPASEGMLDLSHLEHKVSCVYADVVDEVAAACRDKCVDEFYTTKLLHWSYESGILGESVDEHPKRRNKHRHGDAQPPAAPAAAAAAAEISVPKLAAALFVEVRDGLLKNLMLKVHSFLLVAVSEALGVQLLHSVALMNEHELTEIFAVPTTRLQLQRRIKDLQTQMSTSSAWEGLLERASIAFAGQA